MSNLPNQTISRRTFVAAASTTAAGATFLGAPAFAQSGNITLKWANNIPVTHPSNIRIKEAADAIRAETGGKVDIQIFPNNQLGGDTDMLSQVRSGAIDIFPLSGLILQTLVPLAGINGLAFAFKDYQTVWAAMMATWGCSFARRLPRSTCTALTAFWTTASETSPHQPNPSLPLKI